jgi:hypothetical protein
MDRGAGGWRGRGGGTGRKGRRGDGGRKSVWGGGGVEVVEERGGWGGVRGGGVGVGDVARDVLARS